MGAECDRGVQAAAREARYHLLCAAAARHCCEAIVTAHTADDQAETVFMRLARGANARGLAAMAPHTRIAAGAGDPISLLRPFLSVTRATLRATLADRGHAYLDDPSNDDPTFERVRIRGLLAALGEQDLITREALCMVAARAREASETQRREERAAFAAAGGVFLHWGAVTARRGLFDGEAGPGLAQRLIFSVGGGGTPRF